MTTEPIEPPAEPETDAADARLADLASHPRIADPATRDEYLRSALDLVGAIGLDPESFIHSAGASEFHALDQVADWKAKAERYDAAMAGRAEPIRAGARTMRPNAAGAEQAAARRAAQDTARRLQSTGSVHDAAAALAAIL